MSDLGPAGDPAKRSSSTRITPLTRALSHAAHQVCDYLYTTDPETDYSRGEISLALEQEDQ